MCHLMFTALRDCLSCPSIIIGCGNYIPLSSFSTHKHLGGMHYHCHYWQVGKLRLREGKAIAQGHRGAELYFAETMLLSTLRRKSWASGLLSDLPKVKNFHNRVPNVHSLDPSFRCLQYLMAILTVPPPSVHLNSFLILEPWWTSAPAK